MCRSVYVGFMETATDTQTLKGDAMLIVTSPTHHSALTADQSDALMERRSTFGPEDAVYAASIANIVWDGPAIMVRVAPDAYLTMEVA